MERILLLTNPMLEILSAAAGGALALNLLCGMTIVELPSLPALRLRLPADAPREMLARLEQVLHVPPLPGTSSSQIGVA